MRRVTRHAPLVALLIFLAGCRSSLPVYEMMSSQDTRRLMADQFRSIDVVRVVGRLTLTSSSGNRTSVDFATVLDRTQMKMRIWKFNAVVYDLTVTDEGVWVYDALKDRDSSVTLDPGDMYQAWHLFMGSFFLETAARERGLDTSTITYELRRDSESIQCVIDRRRLVARSYTITRDSDGALSMTLARYRMANGMPWPARMTLHGPAGRIQIRLSDISFPDIDTTAIFTPSLRAERMR